MFNPHRHFFDRVELVIMVSSHGKASELYCVRRCLECGVGLKLERVSKYKMKDFIKRYPEKAIELREKPDTSDTELIRAGTLEWDNFPPYKDLTHKDKGAK